MTRTKAEAVDRWTFERVLRQAGLTRIAGVDEAGRGPLAGPVVAAAAVLPPQWESGGLPTELEGLNDSKQLTEAKRERFFEFLVRTEGVRYAVAVLDAGVIDQINILQATHRAMIHALAQLTIVPEHVLVDGNPVRSIPFPQTAIVGGDGRSYSIAAASVLAKVTRDRIMVAYDAEWPDYGFAAHKGYATPQHFAAIQAKGPCAIHRLSFSPLRPAPLSLQVEFSMEL